MCGRTENAIFNSDRSIPPIQVFQYNQNHNNTDLERKKKERFPFLLTPAEKECGDPALIRVEEGGRVLVAKWCLTWTGAS